MALDTLTQGSPAVTNNNGATQTTLPDWYNSYIQGIASKATDIAQTPYQQYPGQQIADFTPAQQQAFGQVQANQGSYQPALTAAGTALNGVMPGVNSALGAAQGQGAAATQAVAGPAQSWTDPGIAASYMSPYTSSVVNEIGRLGDQNLQQNIIPGVQSNFVGSGQFGSTRNAQILGQNVRDAQTNISGLQSNALQAGYTGAENQFNADAGRAQTQGSLQANAALGAGSLDTTGAQVGANAGLYTGQALSGLGQLTSSLGYNDASALNSIGTQQQQLAQTGDTTAYNNFLNQQNWDWSQLGKVQSAVSGAQLPVGTTTASNQSTTPAGTSPLQWLTSLSSLYNSTTSPTSPTAG